MTDSSFLAPMDGPLRRIGMGHCGSVWASPEPKLDGHDVALKREDGGPGRSISNEHSIHLHLLQSLQEDKIRSGFGHALQTNIPICHGFIRSQDLDRWAWILSSLPPGYTPCNALLSERIPPMARAIRQLLVDRYCPDHIRSTVAGDANNDDCIIRAYLGRRRTPATSRGPSRFSAFSLRNFPLHADQMEELGLDLHQYSSAMAEALAFMHWCARIDAKDVEFVLAPCRQLNNRDESRPPRLGSDAPFTTGQLGQHAVWILDFDCCRNITLDEDGIDQAVAAFYRNDPFYPRPGRAKDSVDAGVWQVFRHDYLAASDRLLEGESQDICRLPDLFVQRLIQRAHDFRSSPVT